MNINYKLVSGILLALVIADEAICLVNVKRTKRLIEMNKYLADKLDEHQVPITEFDKIVISNF